jgi:hypothetical protein
MGDAVHVHGCLRGTRFLQVQGALVWWREMWTDANAGDGGTVESVS